MMRRSLFILAGIVVAVSVSAASLQQSPDEERRAAITAMRAINTAENAIRQSTGKYVELAALLDHPMMGRVKANITVTGSVVTHQGARVRLTLSADASQYQAMVVPVATCGTAAFSDERGLIYAGKVLDC